MVTLDPERRDGTLRSEEGGVREARALDGLPPGNSQVLKELADATRAADTERIVDVVRSGWFDLLVDSNPMVLDVVGNLPPATLRDSPLLAMLAGVLYYRVPHRRLKGFRLFVGAISAAASGRRALDSIDRALVLTSASASYRLIGRASLGIKPARTALRILRSMSEADRQKIHFLPRIYAHLGTTLYYGGLVGEAIAAFERGCLAIPRTGYPHGYMNIAMLAGIHAQRGDIRQSRATLTSARSPQWSEAARSMYPGTFYRIAEAIVSLEHFDAPTARFHLEAMDHDRSTIEHWIPIALTEALTGLIEGRPGAAFASLDAFAATRQGEGRSASARKQLAPMRALLQLSLNNSDAAVAILNRDAAPGAEREIARARAELVSGDHRAALHRLRRVARASLTTRLAAEALVVETACLLRLADRSPNRSALEHLGATLQRSGLRLPLALIPASDLDRVRSALSDAGFAHLATDPSVTSLIPDPEAGEPLSERELAVLQALVSTASNAAIAKELVVSVNTVKTQLKGIYRKLNVSNRDEAVAVALARRLATALPQLPSEAP